MSHWTTTLHGRSTAAEPRVCMQRHIHSVEHTPLSAPCTLLDLPLEEWLHGDPGPLHTLVDVAAHQAGCCNALAVWWEAEGVSGRYMRGAVALWYLTPRHVNPVCCVHVVVVSWVCCIPPRRRCAMGVLHTPPPLSSHSLTMSAPSASSWTAPSACNGPIRSSTCLTTTTRGLCAGTLTCLPTRRCG